MAVSLLSLIAGCGTTHIKSARTAAGMEAPPFHKVMVIGVDQRPEVRDGFENRVVALLREHGVDGTASYAGLPFDQVVKGDKEQIRLRLLAAKEQAVLFVRITGQNDFVEGPPMSVGTMDMGAVDESRYVAFTAAGGEVNTSFRLGARVYRVSDGAVIWSAVLDEVLKEDADPLAFIERTAKNIVERMAKDKVIP